MATKQAKNPKSEQKYKRMVSSIKGHGAKYYLAPWIAGHFPDRDTYITFVDAMCRTLAVLFAHDWTGKAEIANDVDTRIANYWKCMVSPTLFNQLKRTMEATPFSEPLFEAARERMATWPAGYQNLYPN